MLAMLLLLAALGLPDAVAMPTWQVSIPEERQTAAPQMPLRWLDPSGRPTAQALALVDVLRDPSLLGLDAADYTDMSAMLAERYAVAPDPAAAAVFEQSLSDNLQRLVLHLHRGRVDPRRLGAEFDVDRKQIDITAALDRLAYGSDPLAVLAGFEPPFPGYRRLRAALAATLALSAQQDAAELPALPGRVLEPGDDYAGAPALVAWLAHLGDLPAAALPVAAEPAALRYEGATVEAVQRFQRRHGLDSDGRIGPATLAELQTPLGARAEQIRLSLERWRWVPAARSQPPIVVNIPEFRLRAIGDDGRVGFATDVVVGRAFRRQTPVFTGLLQTVVFQPSWYVPTSIVRGDLLSRARADPGYLGANGYEILGGSSQQVDDDILQGLRSGRLGLRQRPGPQNALGRVKFLFPNDHSVYLHDTPTTALFERARRDFSSGCIRLRDPGGLAEWVLRKQSDWSSERINAAMQSGPGDQRVAVLPPIPVYLVYVTAVAPENGEVHFFGDIYGHDARLRRALAAR